MGPIKISQSNLTDCVELATASFFALLLALTLTHYFAEYSAFLLLFNFKL